MRVTSVPQVTAALVALWKPLVAPVRVSVGPPVGDLPDKYLAVAYGGDDRPGVVGFGKPNIMANPKDARAEEFTLWCTASTASGDQSGQSRMDSTAALFALAADALGADGHLGGAVVAPGIAQLDTYEWVVEDEGTIATVFFAVKVLQEWFT